MTQYQRSQPPQPRKHTTRNTVLVVLAAVLLAYPAFQLVLLGYTGVRLLIAGQEKHEVVYKVTGSATAPDIRYSRTGHGESSEAVQARLPWQSAPLRTKGSSQVLSVHASPQSDETGTLRCEIWVDGKLVDSDEPAATYLSASCTNLP